MNNVETKTNSVSVDVSRNYKLNIYLPILIPIDWTDEAEEFEFLSSGNERRQFRAFEVPYVMRCVDGRWQYCTEQSPKWRPAQGVSFVCPDTQRTVVFTNFDEFKKITDGAEFHYWNDLAMFLDGETEGLDWLETELIFGQ